MAPTRALDRLPDAGRFPIFRAVLAQGVGAALAFGIAGTLRPDTPLVTVLAAQGVIAAVLGLKLGLARWWIPLNLLLPPLVPLALGLHLPAWIYGVAFLALVLVQWNSAGERVPLYLTNRKTWTALADLLPERQGFSAVDLGSGIGGTLLFLAARRSDGRFKGIESAPAPFLLSELRRLLSSSCTATFQWGDFWGEDLGGYDFVYCFLSPEPMPKLFEKARAEMKAGSLFVSNSFEVPGHAADRVVEVGDRRGTRLHVWRMGSF